MLPINLTLASSLFSLLAYCFLVFLFSCFLVSSQKRTSCATTATRHIVPHHTTPHDTTPYHTATQRAQLLLSSFSSSSSSPPVTAYSMARLEPFNYQHYCALSSPTTYGDGDDKAVPSKNSRLFGGCSSEILYIYQPSLKLER